MTGSAAHGAVEIKKNYRFLFPLPFHGKGLDEVVIAELNSQGPICTEALQAIIFPKQKSGLRLQVLPRQMSVAPVACPGPRKMSPDNHVVVMLHHFVSELVDMGEPAAT